jgi:hypothetical protein
VLKQFDFTLLPGISGLNEPVTMKIWKSTEFPGAKNLSPLLFAEIGIPIFSERCPSHTGNLS